VSAIEDYALIGDCETAALVGRDGSVDWLCWPRFDSDAVFAALLGKQEHGCWRIAPRGKAKVQRRYIDSTLVLQTDFDCGDEGALRLTDFMPLREGHSHLIRIVEGLRGRVAVEMELILRFGYGEQVPWVSRLDDGALRATAGPDMAVLRAPVEVRGRGQTSVSEFAVAQGQRLTFTLTYAPSHVETPKPFDAEQVLDDTIAKWRDWSAASNYQGEWGEAVQRSLITLKALTYGPTGGIVAAPTTSLPETVGGSRNWDYRYCWLRDATLTLEALMNAGYYDEAAAWRRWLERSAAGNPEQLQIMYGLGGERRLMEWEADWLPGYENSRPVRIGNAAARQVQLDVFGELADALYLARRGGLSPDGTAWPLQTVLVEHLEKLWKEPDEGIWEVRGGPRHFTYSKVMAWTALDRAVRTLEETDLEGPLERWRQVRARIHDDVCRNGFDADLGAFVQSYGSKTLDASVLLIPRVGFLPPDDPRVVSTVAAIERRLLVDGFVLRYDAARIADGLDKSEGAFLACSFWLADNYALQGRWKEARALFERLLALRNDVGLLAEEYDPHLRRQVGNFPQAFSHVGLINTAFRLAQQTEGKTGQGSGARVASDVRP
jgi:GH15 family glucan-1,4-alpha-glucosidase